MRHADRYKPRDSVYWDRVSSIVVYQDKNLGDALLATPVIDQLLRYNPQLKITVICGASSSDIFSHLSNVVTVILAPKAFWKTVALGLALRKQSPDVFVDLHGGKFGAFLSMLMRPSASCSVRNWGFGKRFYTHRLPKILTPTSFRHTIENNLDILRRLGFVVDEWRNIRVDSLLVLASTSLCDLVSELEGQPFIVVHPCARWMFKTASVTAWVRLIKAIGRLGFTVVLTGGNDPSEINFCDEIESECDVRNICGLLSIAELARIIDLAQFYVGVDTFASHLAGGLRKRGVVFFGPSDERVWDPSAVYGELTVLVDESYKCRPCNIDGCGGGKRSDCLEFVGNDNTLGTVVRELKLSGH